MPVPQQPDPTDAKRVSDASAGPPRTVSFEALTEGRNEIVIQHNGQEYRLRATRNGGLILNK